jgi:hypothetical protein
VLLTLARVVDRIGKLAESGEGIISAKALRRHVRRALLAERAPDLFRCCRVLRRGRAFISLEDIMGASSSRHAWMLIFSLLDRLHVFV